MLKSSKKPGPEADAGSWRNRKNWTLYGSLKDPVTGFSFEKGPVEFSSNKDFFSHPLMAFMGVNCGDEEGCVKNRALSGFHIVAAP
jgi:hypothetical protein